MSISVMFNLTITGRSTLVTFSNKSFLDHFMLIENDTGPGKWKKVFFAVFLFFAVVFLHKKASKNTVALPVKPKKSAEKTGQNIGDDEFIPGKELVKQMVLHAWRGYREHAWGKDELNPVSRTGSDFYGQHSLALTIIDSLDTLLITGLNKEYIEARDYALKVNFDKDMEISVFESNIRIVGGFLSAFALTGEGKYVSRAYDLANRYLAIFEGEYALRHVDLMAHTKVDKKNELPGVYILSEIGTLSMELAYLSYIIKEPTLKNHALEIIKRLSQLKSRYDGLLPKLIAANSVMQDGMYTVGGMADSYYEYLLKYYIQSGKTDQLHLNLLRSSLEVLHNIDSF